MKKISDLLFFRGSHVCPRWLCFTFDNAFRKLLHDPYKILQPYVKDGNTVLDIGPGIGYFTIPLAKMVGDKGLVIAADIQQKMLDAISKRTQRVDVSQRVKLHLVSSDLLTVPMKMDFALAFWMAHEVPDQDSFFVQVYSLLNSSGRLLIVEPKFHVNQKKFASVLTCALKAGFVLGSRPQISLSRAVLLIKTN